MVSNDRISSRQMDELIGLARGLCADGVINAAEVEFLQKWLAASLAANDQPLFQTLWERLSQVLEDGCVDEQEHRDLFDLLQSLTGKETELGEVLKSTTLPLCKPPPRITFGGTMFCFTGTFSFGQRKDCEKAVEERGAVAGSLTKRTDFLVIGSYATEAWKHSSMGNKIIRACDLKAQGLPITIVSEEHWASFL